MMKNTRFLGLGLLVGLTLMSVGCSPKEISETANPDEAMFVFSLEGTVAKDASADVNPDDYVKDAKVSAREYVVNQRRMSTGRMPWSFKYIPTEEAVKVSLRPVTLLFTDDQTTGTSEQNQALRLESSNSVNFSLNANLRAAIIPDDPNNPEAPGASEFVSFFGGEPLAKVVDTFVWGYVQRTAYNYFGTKHINDVSGEIGPGGEEVLRAAREFFRPYGIEIQKFGFVGGVKYTNDDIQKKLDAVINAKNDEDVATKDQASKVKQLAIDVDKAESERDQALLLWGAREGALLKLQLEAIEMQVKTKDAAVENWDGVAPRLVPANAGMTFFFGSNAASSFAEIQKLSAVTDPELDKAAEEVRKRREAQLKQKLEEAEEATNGPSAVPTAPVSDSDK